MTLLNASRVRCMTSGILIIFGVMVLSGGCCGPPPDYMPAQRFRVLDHLTGAPLAGVRAELHTYRPNIVGRGYIADTMHGPSDSDGMIQIGNLDRLKSHVINFRKIGYQRSWASVEGRREPLLMDQVAILAPATKSTRTDSGWPNLVVEATGIIDIPMYREGEPPTTRPATQPGKVAHP